MKKLFIILLALSIYGCEKERCFTCTVTIRGYGYNDTEKVVICGTMTKKEAKEQAASAYVQTSGMTVTAECREQ